MVKGEFERLRSVRWSQEGLESLELFVLELPLAAAGPSFSAPSAYRDMLDILRK